MKYVFLLYDDENAWTSMPENERDELFGSYVAYTHDLKKAGVFLNGAPLEHSAKGKRVRAPGGVMTVENGPFADGKEQLGGFYLVETPNLDEALDWAARCPGASHGWVEVRPVWAISG